MPETLCNSHFRFEVLEPSVADIDYEVVMSSKERLRNVFREDDQWPSDNMTLEYNMRDLGRHLREFNARQAFAYTVREPEGDGYWGCVYTNPSGNYSPLSAIFRAHGSAAAPRAGGPVVHLTT